MSSGTFKVTWTPEDLLSDALKAYGAGAGQLVQEVYEEFAAPEIKKNIIPHIHTKGRTFKGHKTSSTKQGPKLFQHEVKGLTLTVIGRGKWGYLIFPDEGRGAHNPVQQDFMAKGLNDSTDAIVERILAKLSE